MSAITYQVVRTSPGISVVATYTVRLNLAPGHVRVPSALDARASGEWPVGSRTVVSHRGWERHRASPVGHEAAVQTRPLFARRGRPESTYKKSCGRKVAQHTSLQEQVPVPETGG